MTTLDHQSSRRDALRYIAKCGLHAAYATGAMAVLDKIGAFSAWVDEVHAAQLPQNYQVVAGTQLTSTAALVSHGLDAGTATWTLSEVDTPYYLRPRTPVPPATVHKLTATSSAGGAYKLDFAVSAKPRDISHFWLLIYAENLSGGTSNASFLFGDNASYTNRYTYGYSFVSTDNAKWRDVHVPMSAFSVGAGSPDPNNTFTRFRVTLGTPAGAAPTYYICPVWINRSSVPVVTFSFDDKADEDYTNAYAYMQPRGLVGSLAITSGSGNLSIANMQTMQANGWSICNHTHSHPDLAALTPSQIREEIEICRDYMITNGINSSPSVMVYPFGSHSATVDAVVANYYPYAFEANNATAQQSIVDGLQNPHSVNRAVMDLPTTATQIISNINSAVSTGRSVNLYGHKAGPSAITGQTSLTTLQAVCDHVFRLRNANVIDQRNLESMLQGLASPRKRR